MKIYSYRSIWVVLCCLLSSIGYTQSEDLTQDEVYFKNQEKTYQKWLDHSGLGKTLKVHSTIIKTDGLILYLKFPYTDTDSVRNAWTQLKLEFEQQSPLTIEQALFYKMVSIMEIRESIGQIQIYDTYDTRVEYCFKQKIFNRLGEIITETEKCKVKLRDIDFDISDFSKMKSEAVIDVNESTTNQPLTPKQIRELYPPEVVFDRIYSYAKNHYEKTTCENRNPKVTMINSKGVLRFKVTDLCKEVLKDGNPKVCKALQFFGHNCNWIKRERLIFTFTYEETSKGFNLNCMIDGAYGSGFYERVRRGGYHNMEVDFDDELEEYADVFKERIRALLTQP